MKDPDNIQEVLTVKPDFLGFIFYDRSPRYMADLSPQYVRALANIKKVGVFVNQDLNFIQQKVADYGLDLVQLHGSETPEFAGELKNEDIKVIKAFGIDSDFDWQQLVAFEDQVDYFLFDTKSATAHGGTGRLFDWRLLNKYTLDKPYFLSGGIGMEHIEPIYHLEDRRLFAIDVNSKFESEPGKKDIKLLQSAFCHK